MEKSNPMDIFSMGVKDINLFKEEKKESVIYNPKADSGKDGVYRALIRFVANIKNPNKPIVRKFVYWLEDQDGNSAYYDSPTTVNEKCPVQDLFFALRKSESALDKKNSEKLKRREIFYSLVQIIKDPHDEKSEGKIKVFKYGWKIKQKIDEELEPQFDEATQIFDPFEGKNFELTITKQGGFNNYDSSKFQGKKTPMIIDGQLVKPDAEGREKVLEYLKDSPDLDIFEYKPWDTETREKIMTLLQMYRSPGKAIGTITSRTSSHISDVNVMDVTDDFPVEDSDSSAEDTDFEPPARSVKDGSIPENKSFNKADSAGDLKGFLHDLDLA